MSTAYYYPSSYRSRASRRSRAVSFALSAAIGIALIMLLLKLGAPPGRLPFDNRPLSTFDVPPGVTAERTAPRRAATPKRTEVRQVAPPPRLAPPPPVVPPIKPDVIWMTKDQYAAADIGKARAPAAGDGGGAGAGQSADSGSTYGPGEGPGGQRLFNAEWYREPTRAEMVTYMPARTQAGWGIIACRTIEKFHVENCRELAESPGSGIARGLRQASWQFLVRPPRINGKPVDLQPAAVYQSPFLNGVSNSDRITATVGPVRQILDFASEP